MKNKKYINLAVLTVLVFASCMSLFHISGYGITNILWLVILFPIGATSLSKIFIKDRIDLGERISYSAGLFVASLIFIGLILDLIGLAFHHPTLTPNFIIPILDLFFAFIYIFGQKLKKKNINTSYEENKFQGFSTFIPFIFPILSILGVIQLNNGSKSSIFAVLSICLIAVYELYFIFDNRPKDEASYVINIFCVSVALVLSFSLRSNHIIGSDINQEYQVFSTVLRNGLWQPHLLSSTYNACLSITILPSVIKSFLQISPEYIFKFVMQIILCIVPITVYTISKRQLNSKKLAFLASLFFIVQAQFMFEFPALIRQQSALLFFGLICGVASSLVVSRRVKILLLIIFGIGMVLSHYSTAYIGLAFLLIVVILKFILRKWYSTGSIKIKKYKALNVSWYISPRILLILFLFAFFWYGQTLQSTGGVVSKISTSITSFNKYFAADSRSSFIANSLFIGKNSGYNVNTLNKLEATNKARNSYPKSVYSTYTVVPTYPGGPSIDTKLKSISNRLIIQVIPALVKVLVVFGAIVMVVGSLRKHRTIDVGLFVISSGLLFIALIVLPTISENYNIERLYQQILIVLAPAFIIGIAFILKKWPKVVARVGVCFILLYFVCTSNLATQLIYGSSDVNLSNSGVTYYDPFYEQNGEFDSLKWLQSNYTKGSVSLDLYGELHASAYTTIPSSKYIQGLLPSEIPVNGYVYASNSNFNKDLVYEEYKNQVIVYEFPSKFLNEEKNIIYVNKNSVIYK
jgi:uncharacterized membrane protein